MTRQWTPTIPATRRISGRILRAARAGAIDLPGIDHRACVDGCTLPFTATALRRRIGQLWLTFGPTLLRWGEPSLRRNGELDDWLDRVVIASEEHGHGTDHDHPVGGHGLPG